MSAAEGTKTSILDYTPLGAAVNVLSGRGHIYSGRYKEGMANAAAGKGPTFQNGLPGDSQCSNCGSNRISGNQCSLCGGAVMSKAGLRK